jgi:hypothetical protein
MSNVTSLSGASLTAAHRRFEAALPAIDRTLRYLFRRWPEGRRDEALADARAAAWHAWYGLLRRGKDPESVGVTGLAANAARYVRNGRRLGCGTLGRAADVLDPEAGRRHGLRVVSLDDPRGETGDSWRSWLAEDHQFTPADAACFRLDFERWLEGLTTRKRQIADLLVEGHEGVVVARTMGLTPGRVSQVRDELNASWRAFQSQGAIDVGPRVVTTGGRARTS